MRYSVSTDPVVIRPEPGSKLELVVEDGEVTANGEKVRGSAVLKDPTTVDGEGTFRVDPYNPPPKPKRKAAAKKAPAKKATAKKGRSKK